MVGRTSFMIAHRLSTIRKADMILVHEPRRCWSSRARTRSCSREGGLYYQLYEAQTGDVAEIEAEYAQAAQRRRPSASGRLPSRDREALARHEHGANGTSRGRAERPPTAPPRRPARPAASTAPVDEQRRARRIGGERRSAAAGHERLRARACGRRRRTSTEAATSTDEGRDAHGRGGRPWRRADAAPRPQRRRRAWSMTPRPAPARRSSCSE